MGFFSSSKSHLELLEKECDLAITSSSKAREMCDRSLRGKYEYMPPEERAELLREAHALHKKIHAAVESARQHQADMESDQCPGEDLLAAQSLVLQANMDASRLDKALKEAGDSLVSGISEVEQFYGPRSAEAKHLRRVIGEFQASI
jgi:hypothetical protein